jgi:rsbT co-antagonist protein RsbR
LTNSAATRDTHCAKFGLPAGFYQGLSELIFGERMTEPSRISEVLRRHSSDILADWTRQQVTAPKADLIRESDLREQTRTLMNLLREALETGSIADFWGTTWTPVREFLSELSRTRARLGFTPIETATFVFALKLPLFAKLRQECSNDAAALAAETWAATELIDRLGLFTTETQQKLREEVISRQQQELLELSTPVVKLWDGVLALPLIGTLDSARTQVVMENLLQQIVQTGAAIAIIDITGVPTVDTLVAQHLLKTIAAARLMGADCIVSGVRPQIAQTIVHLGVELTNVTTKATLADAFRVALARTGQTIAKLEHSRQV